MGLVLLGIGSAILISGSKDRWVLLFFVFGFLPAIVAVFGALDLVWRDPPRTTDESDAPRRRTLVASIAMSQIFLAAAAAGYVAIAVLVVRLIYQSRHGDLGVALALLPFAGVAVWRGSTNLRRLIRPRRDAREPRP